MLITVLMKLCINRTRYILHVIFGQQCVNDYRRYKSDVIVNVISCIYDRLLVVKKIFRYNTRTFLNVNQQIYDISLYSKIFYFIS